MPIKFGATKAEEVPPSEVMALIEKGTEALCSIFEAIRREGGERDVTWGCIVSAVISDMGTLMINDPKNAKEIQEDFIKRGQVLLDAVRSMTPEQLEKINEHGLSGRGTH